MKEKEFNIYSPTSYAEHVGKSVRTIYNWIHEGKIDARAVVGGGWVIFEKVKEDE